MNALLVLPLAFLCWRAEDHRVYLVLDPLVAREEFAFCIPTSPTHPTPENPE